MTVRMIERMLSPDWNPAAYARFADLRLQPALDLLSRVGDLPAGDVVDLGCGAGTAGPVLRQRFAGRRLVGVDGSAAMLEQARAAQTHDSLVEADIASWTPEAPPALIFSNAALQWLPDHESLLPLLAGLLAPGGVLAIQMPHQNRAPSHRVWVDLAERMLPGRIDDAVLPGIGEAAEYHAMLSPLGRLGLWETEYFQTLPAGDEGHPVRAFTSSTFARPILSALDDGARDEICLAYDNAMEAVYPRAEDGSVLFPFKRLFLTLGPTP